MPLRLKIGENRFMVTGLFAAIALLQSAAAAPDVEVAFWRGRDAYKLVNPVMEATVVPSLGGRIMDLRLKGGDNVLYAPAKMENLGGWHNHGGDKVWFAPQSLWSWPPDPWIEQREHQVVSVDGPEITIQSPISEAWGLQVTRTIRIHPTEPRLIFDTKLTNHWPRTIKVSPWHVVQVDRPSVARMELDRRAFPEDGYIVLQENPLVPGYDGASSTSILLTSGPKTARKVGGRGRVIQAVSGFVRIRMINEFAGTPLADQGEFPDGGVWNQIFFASEGAGYAELEVLGALASLGKDQSTQMRTWLTLE